MAADVARDPPSPFLTVQHDCGLDVPAGAAAGRARHLQPTGSGLRTSRRVAADAPLRSHLESIVSEQSLCFAPPDSPLEFEALNGPGGPGAKPLGDGAGSGAAAAAAALLLQQQAAAEAACKPGLARFLGRRCKSHAGAERVSDSDDQQPQDAELSLGRPLSFQGGQQQPRCQSRRHSCDGAGPSLRHCHTMTHKLRSKVNKLLSSLASARQQQQGAPDASSHAQQAQALPQLQPLQLIPTAACATPARSPLASSSLVSSPSSVCDCPPLLALAGRFSSAGSEPPPPGSSLSTTPSPGRLSAAGNAAAAEVSTLVTTSSVRQPHARHRQHLPSCRHYQEQQPSFPQLSQAQPQQAQPAKQPQQPPAAGVLTPQSSLRTALQQLETMASAKAGRLMDRLNYGLQKVTSHRIFDGVLRNGGTVGREVMRDWEFGAYLGSGASCVARLVTERCTGRTAACKTINKAGIMHSAAVKAELLAVQREVAILQATKGHPHVVQLHAVYEDMHNLHMILEWCVGGSLVDLMARCSGFKLPEPAAAAATKAVLEVLMLCHAKGVMHRDIKPDNLLIARPLGDARELTDEIIKVTDFGISLPFTDGQLLDELAGTPGYMAPEVLQRRYNQAADVWSTGVMLYEMITGRLPFAAGSTVEECLVAVSEGEPDLECAEWAVVSSDARALVRAMLVKDPAQRPTPDKLLQAYQPWLALGSAQAARC